MALIEPIRDKKQLREMAVYWLKRGSVRNYALIVLGACTALRPGDLLRLCWADVYDGSKRAFRTHITLTERKTGKRKTIALNGQAVKALRMLFPNRRSAFIFATSRRDGKPIGRVQAWRIVRAAANATGAAGRIALYSLRKAFGYFAWQAGAPPVLLMDIFNHSSFEVTRRYLGIAQQDRDRVYLGMALF